MPHPKASGAPNDFAAFAETGAFYPWMFSVQRWMFEVLLFTPQGNDVPFVAIYFFKNLKRRALDLQHFVKRGVAHLIQFGAIFANNAGKVCHLTKLGCAAQL